MEGQKPVLGRRKISAFNPQAATFNPTQATAISKGKEFAKATIATPTTTPQEHFRIPTVLAHDSPVPLAENVRSDYYRDAIASRELAGLEGSRFGDVPFAVVQKMLLEHHLASTDGTTGMPLLGRALPTDPMRWPVTRDPPSLLPPPGFEPNRNTVDVEELSASLGLPGMKKNVTFDQSHHSEGSHDPFFAQHLNTGKRIFSDGSTPASGDYQRPMVGFSTPSCEDGQATKTVRPPPGFRGMGSRTIAVEDPLSVAPTVTEPKYVPTGPDMFRYAQSQNLFPAAHQTPPNARHSSNRRRSRAHTRTKRTDQGPEPSAADIYPEDAIWEPSYKPFLGKETEYKRPSFVHQLPSQQQLLVDDTISWPTPAEVYTYPPTTKVSTRKPDTPPHSPVFSIFENHARPTEQDINAADNEVLAMISELPHVQVPTLLKFGAVDLICDDRPLTPGQADGSRYGMKYHALGLGDAWSCPHANEEESFRVRPRNHDGWGGWDWALKHGWGDN
ncbi:Nn.00g002030.m01.CDS01 [Neocucurbitaria sp. VM-36]